MSEKMVSYLTKATQENEDYDGVFGTQCVDLPLKVLNELGIVNSISFGNGIDFAKNVEMYLGKEDNTDYMNPENGVLYVVSFYSGEYGHVALLYNGLLYEYNYCNRPNIRSYSTDSVSHIVEVYREPESSSSGWVCNVDSLNIRSSHSLSSPIIGQIYSGNIVYGETLYIDDGYVWLQINECEYCAAGLYTGKVEKDDFLIRR